MYAMECGYSYNNNLYLYKANNYYLYVVNIIFFFYLFTEKNNTLSYFYKTWHLGAGWALEGGTPDAHLSRHIFLYKRVYGNKLAQNKQTSINSVILYLQTNNRESKIMNVINMI